MIKVGLNIGNAKFSCAVIDYKNEKQFNILSIDSIPSTALKKNFVTNVNQMSSELEKLISDSEKNSQTKIKSINLNVHTNGSFSKYYESEIRIENNTISDLDIKKAVNNSDFFSGADNNFFEIHNNLINYNLDGNTLYEKPIGNYANKLKLCFYKISVPAKNINNFKNIINKLNISIDSYVPVPLASSLSVLSDDEKNIGSICIDLGHSNTSVAIFENNKFIYGDSFLVGSNNITNDIARGVSTTLESAERLKTLYSSLISAPSDEFEIIEIPMISGEKNKFSQINRLKINSIVKPRVEETLEMIWQKLKQNNLHKRQIKNVVLTGGGSLLDGIKQYAEFIFSANVRIGYPSVGNLIDSDFNKPIYSDTIGCSLYDQSQFLSEFTEIQGKKRKKYGFKGFFNWLDQYI